MWRFMAERHGLYHLISFFPPTDFAPDNVVLGSAGILVVAAFGVRPVCRRFGFSCGPEVPLLPIRFVVWTYSVAFFFGCSEGVSFLRFQLGCYCMVGTIGV